MQQADDAAKTAADGADAAKRRAAAASAAAKRFSKMRVVAVDLTGNKIGDIGVEALLEVMSAHPTIKVLLLFASGTPGGLLSGWLSAVLLKMVAPLDLRTVLKQCMLTACAGTLWGTGVEHDRERHR